jgi:hypothetical protein
MPGSLIVKTAILIALLVAGISFVMSMLVALMIKGLHGALRRFTHKS